MKSRFDLRYGALIGLGLVCCCANAQQPAVANDSGFVSREVNSELPSWLKFDGEERVRFEDLNGIGYKSAGNDYLLQRLRLNLGVKALSWLNFKFQAEDSRVFLTNVYPAPATQKDAIDLRFGYVQLGTTETSPVSLRAGRQDLTLGEGRLVGDPNWSNVGRTFDGVRATLRYKKFRLDAFSGMSDKIYQNGFDTPIPGEHFDALYGMITNLVPAASIEPYVLWKMEHNIAGELVKSANLEETTAGFRWVGKLPKGFDYGTETAMQRGLLSKEPISSWAGHWVAGYTFPHSAHRPRLFAEFNRASGDRNAKDGVHGAFDPLFASPHDKFGVADQFTWTNIVYSRSGFQYRLSKGLSLSAAYNSFWLANRHDGIYSSGKLVIASNGAEGTHIGQEADVLAQWTIKRYTAVDLDFGHIFPGEFLHNAGRNVSYNCVFLGVGQRF